MWGALTWIVRTGTAARRYSRKKSFRLSDLAGAVIKHGTIKLNGLFLAPVSMIPYIPWQLSRNGNAEWFSVVASVVILWRHTKWSKRKQQLHIARNCEYHNIYLLGQTPLSISCNTSWSSERNSRCPRIVAVQPLLFTKHTARGHASWLILDSRYRYTINSLEQVLTFFYISKGA